MEVILQTFFQNNWFSVEAEINSNHHITKDEIARELEIIKKALAVPVIMMGIAHLYLGIDAQSP